MSSKVTLPPISWKLLQKNDELILDAEWKFPICSTSKQTYEIYIYEVKDFPELLKIGISKDSTKRTENYYGQLLWKESFDKRTASMIEYLFMHSTYHKAHNSLPQQNVGNFAYATALSILKTFFDNVEHESKGITEVRQMTFDEAKYTLKYIEDILITKDLFEAISICGIRTFEGLDGIRSVVTIKKGNTWHDSKFSLSENNELQSTLDVIVDGSKKNYTLSSDSASFTLTIPFSSENEVIEIVSGGTTTPTPNPAVPIPQPKPVPEVENSVNEEISISMDFTNTSDDSQTFAYIVQIMNQNGQVISLSFINGLLGTGQSLDQTISYMPKEPGVYTAEKFLWSDLKNPYTLTDEKEVFTFSVKQ